MLFSRLIQATLLLVCIFAFSGCSSQKNDDITTVHGQAIKGLIANGSVSAYQISSEDQSLTLLSTTETNADGNFSLELEVNAFNGPTLIQINAHESTTMVCELVDGCTNLSNGNWYEYGEASPVPAEFQLLGLAIRSDNGRYQANVSALSHLIVSTALNLPGGLNKHNIAQASEWVEDAFRLNASPLKTPLTDITKLSEHTSLDEGSLIQSILGASFYELSQTEDWYEGKVSVHDIQRAEIYTLANSLTGAITQTLSTTDAQHLSQLSRTHFSNNTDALEILSQPYAVEVTEGASFYFRVYAVSPDPIYYQWLHNGKEIPNATSPVYGVNHAAKVNAGSYSVQISSANANLSSDAAPLVVHENNELFISRHPQSASLVNGQALQLGIEVQNGESAKISWQKDGSLVPGQNARTLQINSVEEKDNGNYRAIVEQDGAVVFSEFARVSVTDGLAPITINAPPTAQDLLEGQAASLSVIANGGGYLRYQWFKNGSALAEATQATLYLGAANPSIEGNYHVQISNSVGTIRSDTARIRVIDRSVALTLSEQPQAASIYKGHDYTMRVASPFATQHQYQWFKNGTAIAGAVSREYSIISASEQDAGQYHAVVSNVLGTVTSTSANINILPLPSLALSWAMPSERENGEALNPSEIYGYKLAYGYTPKKISYQQDVAGPYNTQFTLQSLQPGTVFLQIATIDSDGVTGRFSSPIEVQLP